MGGDHRVNSQTPNVVSTGEVRVSRRIPAPAAKIFAVLATPARHLDLDGSGMLRGAVTDHPMRGVGDFFDMRMYYVEHGDYQMRNHIVEFEPTRRSSGSPSHGSATPTTVGPTPVGGNAGDSSSSRRGRTPRS